MLFSEHVPPKYASRIFYCRDHFCCLCRKQTWKGSLRHSWKVSLITAFGRIYFQKCYHGIRNKNVSWHHKSIFRYHSQMWHFWISWRKNKEREREYCAHWHLIKYYNTKKKTSRNTFCITSTYSTETNLNPSNIPAKLLRHSQIASVCANSLYFLNFCLWTWTGA